MIAAWFAKPLVKYGAIALGILALIVGVVIYLDSVRNEGRKAGAADVTTKVQEKALQELDAARKSKEKTDEEVRKTPYDDKLEGLK
jgi:hypothetical protein